MPNHVINIITFENPEDLKTIFSKLPPAKGVGLSFEQLIPSPKSIEECPKEYILKERAGVAKDSDKPWFDWYHWQVDNWGTKWDAYEINIDMNNGIVEFQTAWDAPLPIFAALANFKFPFEVKFADEDIGCNCGTYSCNENGLTDIYYYPNSTDEAQKFSVETWGNDYNEWLEEQEDYEHEEELAEDCFVKHFKRETINTVEEPFKYLYQIVCFAKHTEDDDYLVIYKTLDNDPVYYAKPYSLFMSRVDKEKYPNIKQKYRFELIKK